MTKSYLTIFQQPGYIDNEPVYEIGDHKTKTLIALATQPLTKKDIVYDYMSPLTWLKSAVGDDDINENTKIYAASYDEVKHIASQHNLKMLSSH